MKEAYVSFGVAEKLKKKGFNWKCIAVYIMTEEKHLPHILDTLLDYNSGEVKDCISCPTQQMACRWLREVHKIDISVTPDDGSWWIKITELESWSGVFDGKVLNSDDIKHAYEGDTSTKEGCYEAALEYVLKNLI